jgi:hypothetical protein
MSNKLWGGDDSQWPEPKAPEEQKWQGHATAGKQQASAQQRQAPDPATKEEPPPALFFPADRVYVPYETRTRPESLILLTTLMPAQGAAYHQLEHFSFDQHHGQFLTLFYPSMQVHMTGQLLAPVIHAAISFKCAIIREWHRDFYDPPTRGIAVIESITITPTGAEP